MPCAVPVPRRCSVARRRGGRPGGPSPRAVARRAGLLALLLALAGSRPLLAGEARNPAEVYERRSRVIDALLYVVSDLKARAAAAPGRGDPVLLLVVDPEPALKNELAELRAGVDIALREGPPGLHLGVLGAGSDLVPPSMNGAVARGALESFELLPVPGPKNLLAAVRQGLGALSAVPGQGPRALLLVSEQGGDGEDDVEATRGVLLDSGAAFYALAGEAAFERPWEYSFEARRDPAGHWVERFTPEVRKKETTLYFGGEVAFGLVPYRWELDLAQTEFLWAQPPRYPVPSGFGYWSLATLAYTSGGRYFLYDFPQAGLSEQRAGRRLTLYEPSRLALLAPDLRPRARVLKDLAKDGRARTVVRIWEALADEALPVLQDLGTLEAGGTGLAVRPARPVRSTSAVPGWIESVDDLPKARAWVARRVAALDQALGWWAQENGKPRTETPGADALLERLEADFQLLGVQLKRVRFHLGEALAAYDTIRALDLTQRRARVLPVPLGVTTETTRPLPDLGDADRNARLADLVAAVRRMEERYRGTPWALLLQRSWWLTFKKDVQIVAPEEEAPARREPERPGRGTPPPPPKPTPPPAPPPDGPRPGSGSGGPTTGR